MKKLFSKISSYLEKVSDWLDTKSGKYTMMCFWTVMLVIDIYRGRAGWAALDLFFLLLNGGYVKIQFSSGAPEVCAVEVSKLGDEEDYNWITKLTYTDGKTKEHYFYSGVLAEEFAKTATTVTR